MPTYETAKSIYFAGLGCCSVRSQFGILFGVLVGFKCPRSVDFREQLPRTDGGKLFKRLLRDEYRRTADTSDPGS